LTRLKTRYVSQVDGNPHENRVKFVLHMLEQLANHRRHSTVWRFNVSLYIEQIISQ
jgi:hypothetical protein